MTLHISLTAISTLAGRLKDSCEPARPVDEARNRPLYPFWQEDTQHSLGQKLDRQSWLV